MATLTATRATSTFPVAQFSGGGVLQVAYGSYALASNPTGGDILKICKVPGGSTIIGGWLRASDLDTGSGTLDIDVGWLGNGVEATNASGLGDFGALNGTAVTNYLPEGGILIPLNGLLNSQAVTFTNETTITVTFVVAANAFTAGQVGVVVYYTTAN